MAIGKWRRKVSGRAAESPESGRRFGSIAAVAALGLCLVACQRDEAGATRVGSGQAQRQSIIDFAQTLKDRTRQCTGDAPRPQSPGTQSKVLAAAWATVERNKETSCTQLMMDLGSGKIFPQSWPEDQRTTFRRALNTYAKYAAQNMARSQNEAMFVESVQDDEDATGEIERYTKAIGPQSVTFRDRGEKLFREAAKGYGVGDRDLRLPDS